MTFVSTQYSDTFVAPSVGYLGIVGDSTCASPEYVALASSDAGSYLHYGTDFQSASQSGSVLDGDSSFPTTNLALGDFAGLGFAQAASVSQSNASVLRDTPLSSGTFQQPGPVAALPAGSNSSNPVWLVAGDFNQDCNLDLMVLFQGPSLPLLWFLAGSGSGTFFEVNHYPLLNPPVAAVATTVSGSPGLAIAENSNAAGFVEVRAGCGPTDCSLTQTLLLPITSAFIGGIVAADFDGNGAPDFAVWTTQNTGDYEVWAYLSTGGSFQAVSQQIDTGSADFAAPAPVVLVPADFDQDGKVDLLVLTVATGGKNTTNAQLYVGNGNGTFTTGHSFTYTGRTDSATAYDVDGDGRPDLVAGTVTWNAAIQPFLNQCQ